MKNAEIEGDDNLVMFFGMLNLPKLANILPFNGPDETHLQDSTVLQRVEYLKSKSTALTCKGWGRVFGSNHATIEKDPNMQIKTFAVRLNKDQVAQTDFFESVGVYYDRIRVPIILHPKNK